MGTARSASGIRRAAVTAATALACSVPNELLDERVRCTDWAAVDATSTAVAREARWFLVDRAGERLVYRSTSRGVVVRRMAAGEERDIQLDGVSVFPTAFDAGRLLVFYERRADGFQQYYLLDVERCALDFLPVVVSTADVDIGFSKVAAAALSGDRLFYAVWRGALVPADEILLDLAGMQARSADATARSVYAAAMDGDRVFWFQHRDAVPSPGLAEWRLSDGAITTFELPAEASPEGLSASGTRVVWTDFRNARWTRDENVFLADFATGIVTQLTTNAAPQNQPSILGRLVAWSDERAGNYDIRVRDLDSVEEVVAVATPEDERSPVLTAAGLFWTIPGPEGAEIHFDPAIRP